MKPYVCEFDLTPVVYPRPHCIHCDRLLDKGYAYVRPDKVTGFPMIDFCCFDDAPPWIREAATESTGTISPGDITPPLKAGTKVGTQQLVSTKEVV